MKKVLSLFIFFLFAVALMKGFYFFTDGFRLNKLVYFSKDNIFQEEKQLDEKIINQKFFYLGKGRQSYVFESEDKKYVIKLVRYHKYQRPLWSCFFSSLTLDFEKHKIMLFQKEERKKRAFDSYLIAKKELNFLSHVNYLHLNKTKNLRKKIYLYDAIRRKHVLNLDDVLFIIQKRAESFQERMLSLYKEKNDEKLKELIISFIDMVSCRLEKNIANRDYMNYVRNCGVINNRAMEVDIGSFYIKDLKTFSSKDEELKLCLYPLEKFINENMPSFQLFLEEKKNRIIARF